EQDAHVAAFGGAKKRSPLAPDSVHDRTDVIHPLLEGRKADVAVGHPGAAFVEHDHAGKAAQPLEKVSVSRVLPGVLDMRDPARHIDEIERTLAEHLAGADDAAVLGVSGLRLHCSAIVFCLPGTCAS